MILEDRKILRTESYDSGSSVNIKERCSSLRKVLSRQHQKGSILIGLIITMVIIATLGAAMVYLTSTSAFQGLFSANSHTRAYYTADSGGRYALSVIRDAYATGMTKLSVINNNQTFTLANNGGQFQITNWVQDGNDPETVTFNSIGTVNSGFLQAKRLLTYRIQTANQLKGSSSSNSAALPLAVSDFSRPKGHGSDAEWLGQYFTPTENSETKIFKVDDDHHNHGDDALNLASFCYTTGLEWYNNTSMAQLDTIRTANGGLLSYGAQVKVVVDAKDKNSSYNIIGISFRLDDSDDDDDNKDNMYGISFVKLPSKHDNECNDHDAPDWYTGMVCPNHAWDVISTGKWFVVLWKRTGVHDDHHHNDHNHHNQDHNENDYHGCSSGTYKPLAYKALTYPANSACSDGNSTGCTEIKDWATLYINVVEMKAVSGNPYGYTVGTLYNEIKSYLPAYTRSTTDNPIIPSWNNTNLITWTTVTGGATAKSGSANTIIVDSSLTTRNYNSYTSTTRTKAREIGLHIFYDSTEAQSVFYDNFYIDLSPSTGVAGADGNGSVIVSP